MSNKLNGVLGNMATPGVERLRGVRGMEYRAVNVQVEKPQSGLLDALGKFAKVGADVYTAVDERNKAKADERSNEIIRKLTPEQRREAIENGTLLYQDDPYAMRALKFKTGRNAAFLVDDEVQQGIREGRFRTRDELEKYRHSRLKETSKSFAEQFGIDEIDDEYQKGFNANITERNISLYGAHDSFLSEQAQKGAVLNSKVELNGVLSDPELLASPESGEFFQNYINSSLTTGMTDNQAQQVITSSLGDVLQRPGGAAFLKSLENRKVKLNGAETTYKELMGDEQWQTMMLKAQHSQFKNDAKLTEKFRLGVSSAINQDDSSKGWEALQGLKGELDKLQPGEEMTPEREWLISAQEHMQNRFKQEQAAVAKEMDKQAKTMNKNLVIDKQFQKRLGGEYVSTSYKDMPTNENTGEFKHSDMVNYANQKLAEIDSMDLPPEQKDRLKLSYLRADSNGGAFREAFGTMVADAGAEWSSAVINGRLPESTQALDNLRRVRNVDPDLVAALYPDKAELFLTLDQMDSQGLDTQILIDGDKSKLQKTKEMRQEDDLAWDAMMRDSTNPQIKYMPASVQGYARKVYDSVKYRTGNPDMAMEQVSKFLSESTVTFSSDKVKGDTYGVIPKNALTVTDDPKSWEQGRDMVDATMKKLVEANPWVTNKQLSVHYWQDALYIMDTQGKVRVRMDPELMRAEYQETMRKQDEEARDKALKDATKRAPIARVKKAREAAAQRVREKRKSTPKFIYGREED